MGLIDVKIQKENEHLESTHVFESGMKRSSKKPRYDLIDLELLKGIAEVLERGAIKYGRDNWKKANQEAALDCVNHAIEHLHLFSKGDRSEPHIFNAGCNLMFLAFHLRKHPEWFE